MTLPISRKSHHLVMAREPLRYSPVPPKIGLDKFLLSSHKKPIGSCLFISVCVMYMFY